MAIKHILPLVFAAAGGAALIVKVEELEVPPPGAIFTTVTEGVPAVAISVAEIDAVNRVKETKVVVRAAPPH